MLKLAQKTLACDRLAHYLEAEDVRYVFGIPGSYVLGFYDAVHRSPTLRAVLTKHEQGAALMADGYAKVRGHLACCAATAGPGATNLLTGVATSYMCSQPVLVLAGQVPTSFFGKGALQEGTGLGRTIDQTGLFRAVTKFSERVDDPALIDATVQTAIRAATSGRPGPAYVEVPIDILNSPVPETAPAIEEPESPACDPADIERLAELLRGSGRAAILAGAGALYGEAAPEIAELAESLAIPVATTLKAKGLLPEDHPLALGCTGLFGTNAANAYLRDECDLLLAIGTSFHEFTTAVYDDALRAKKTLVQLDIDHEELGKNYPADLALVGPPKATLRLLLDALETEPGRNGGPPAAVGKLKRKYRHFGEPAMDDDSAPIKPAYLMRCLRRALPRDAIVFSESITWTERYLPCFGPRTHIVGTGLAPIGYAAPASIGGQLAAPDQQVVAVAGDGGFQFNAMELLTAVNYDVPVKWIVLDNGRFGSIFDAQTFLYSGRHTASEFRNPDFVAMAESFGAAGVRLQDPSTLEQDLCRALATDGPVLIDVVTDPEARPPFKPGVMRRTKAWKAPTPDTKAGTRAVLEMLKER